MSSMKPDELAAAARELVERTTREQGFPFHVEDPYVLSRIETLLATAVTEAPDES